MPVMNRIEGAAVNADLSQGVMTRAVAPIPKRKNARARRFLFSAREIDI
jgi:hypothetical protein